MLNNPKNSFIFWISILVIFISVVVIGNANAMDSRSRSLFLYGISALQLFFSFGLMYYIYKKAAGFWPVTTTRNCGKTLAVYALGLGILVIALVLISSFTIRKNDLHIDLSTLAWVIVYQFVFISLVEEVIFRGFVFSSFPMQPLKAILVSSLLFALYHWNNGLISMPYFLSIGVLLAVFRHFNYPLYVLVIWHALFNILNQTLLPFDGFRFGWLPFYTVMPLFFIGVACLSGWILGRIDNKRG